MKRRQFLQALGTSVALLPVYRASGARTVPSTANDQLDVWVSENDNRIANILARQQRQEGHAYRGGFANQYGIYGVGTASNHAASLMAGFLVPQSKYHDSEQVAEALDLASDYLLRRQNSDGTIDLYFTNFHSTPDTAFVVEPLALALSNLRQHRPDGLPGFQEGAAKFLKNAGRALSVGGIHTPNHRWVVCMALAWINKLLPDPAYVQRIDRWLLEGIDIDPDGQYTEQSVSAYSPIVNRCLITIARLLDRPNLFKPVRKNLNMTLYYVHANGELATEASKRQDQYRIATMAPYYYSYRYMSLLDQDRRFSAMAGTIENTVGWKALSRTLIYRLEDSMIGRELPPAGSLPTHYVKHFRHSNLVRIRRHATDATILAGNHSFFTFFKGKAALQAVRMATAFFGKGQFVSPTLRVEGNRYILQQRLRGPYYQPFPKDRIPQDGNWEKMPRSEGAQSEIQNLTSTITIEEDDGRFVIHFDVSGTDHVPVAIELAFRTGGKLSGFSKLEGASDSYLLEHGYGRYQLDDDVIEIGPGRTQHSWTQLHGAQPKLDAQCVYLTGYTPFDLELKVW